jgi:hypothetical protein
VKLIGFVLIAFGLFALIAGGINYTDRDTVIDAGPIKAQVEDRERIPLSPIVGIASLAGGIALVIAGARTKSRV